MNTKKNNWVKFIGLATTITGVAVSLASEYVNDKKMDEKIENKIDEALAKRENGEEF